LDAVIAVIKLPRCCTPSLLRSPLHPSFVSQSSAAHAGRATMRMIYATKCCCLHDWKAAHAHAHMRGEGTSPCPMLTCWVTIAPPCLDVQRWSYSHKLRRLHSIARQCWPRCM